ncbi:adhesion G protein-coupled receptor L4-like [Anneissia japonica]|uniref:adhesion G protein-coupled receptor L4-like n=1 Tax=Anneissia japonica TaxID=1529436 RepID=UPI0014257641|nr:adhesion G protein-coupled receptor L4-like [Anneissia japonica]
MFGFKDLRNSERYKLLRNLVIALLCVNSFYLVRTLQVSGIACSFIAACLHYSLLAAFSWMVIISTDVYMKINHPFADHSKRFTYSRFICWLGSVIVVGPTAGITKGNYASDKCWLNAKSGSIWTFIFPMCISNLIVLVQLIVIGYVAFKKSQLPNQTEEEMQTLKRIRNMFRGILFLVPAVGLSWIFGGIIVFCDWQAMEYIYVIVNSMQGFLILLSQFVFSNEVRQSFRKRFGNQIQQDSSNGTESVGA